MSRPTPSSTSLSLLVSLLPWTCSPPLGSCTVGPWDPHMSCRCVSITFCLVTFVQVFKPVKNLSWRFAFQHHRWFCVSPWVINCVLWVSVARIGKLQFQHSRLDSWERLSVSQTLFILSADVQTKSQPGRRT